ncbi:Multidrug and toxin extrusion (MATE) family efflux pump YdhE/NorM [Minicystis rosea]|nr:Multidrug and toxin extrusion (MATE) family efflux pump YdhE/NorM [Minicystis rosea]
MIRVAARRVRVEAPLAREVWSLAWPAITHMLLLTLIFLAGRAMVGRYSSTALASLQISGTLTWSIYSLFTAFSAGALAVVARSVGGGDRASAARAARASVVLAFAIGLVVALPLRIVNGPLLHALFPHADASVLADASDYLCIVLPALPLAFVEAIAAASLQGAGDTRTPLYVAVAGNVINVVASFVLIFGRFGAPEMGVRGAAIGNAATMIIEGVLLVAALLTRGSPLPIGTVPFDRKTDGDALRRVLRISVPAFAEKGVYHAGYLGFVAIIGLLGAAAMAANQALFAVEAVCYLSADGFGIAAGAVVAQKLGARSEAEAARAGWLAAGMATALMTIFGLLFCTSPRLLIAGFSNDPNIIALGAQALVVAGIAQPFMAFAIVTGMSLRGAGDTRTVFLSTVVCALIVRLSATYLFAIHLGFGLAGVWMGSTADWMVRTFMLAVAYGRGRWRRAHV